MAFDQSEPPGPPPLGFEKPPYNLEAEQSLIGSMLINNAHYHACRGMLEPADFYEPVHQRLYAEIVRTIDGGGLADHRTLFHLFDSDPGLAELGAGKTLERLAISADTIITAVPYARIVRDLSLKRRLAQISTDVGHMARNGVSSVEAFTRAREAIEEIGREIGQDWRGELVSPMAWTSAPPERRWVVPQWVPEREVVLLGGAGGQGKSLLAQQLMTATAIGGWWLGMQVERGPALGFFCEDDPDEIQRRQWAINQAMGISADDLSAMHIWPRRGKINHLVTADGDGRIKLEPLYEQLRAACRSIRPKLVILDTVAHIFGGNENIRGQVTAFVSGPMQALADEAGATVIMCAHPSRSGISDGSGLSGSTAWEGSVRARLYVRKPDDAQHADERVLERKKANYAPADGELRIRWINGAFEPSEVAAAQEASADAGSALVDALRAMAADGVSPSPYERRPEYLPRLAMTYREARGHSFNALKAAYERCVASGRMKTEIFRNASRKDQWRVVLVGE